MLRKARRIWSGEEKWDWRRRRRRETRGWVIVDLVVGWCERRKEREESDRGSRVPRRLGFGPDALCERATNLKDRSRRTVDEPVREVERQDALQAVCSREKDRERRRQRERRNSETGGDVE
jgi:hypothetical protein